MTEHSTSNFELAFSAEELRTANRATQIDVIKTWFYENFENPAERTPYETREGGYMWIWGGPYDAAEEIGNEFSGIVSEKIIEAVVSELERDCIQWAPTPSEDDYDWLVEDISRITEFRDNFSEAIRRIEKLLNLNVDNDIVDYFLRLLYVSVITTLETYLSDAFINTVLKNHSLMRKFIESDPEFKAQQISLSEVFKASEEIEKKARARLINVVWHNIKRVKEMYSTTLDIDFPDDLKVIHQAVQIRHDIVHRNGKSKDGRDIQVDNKDVLDLIESVIQLVDSIDNDLV